MGERIVFPVHAAGTVPGPGDMGGGRVRPVRGTVPRREMGTARGRGGHPELRELRTPPCGGRRGQRWGQDRGGGARSPVHDAWSQSVTQCHAEQDAASVP